jgi:hypothetical protein
MRQDRKIKTAYVKEGEENQLVFVSLVVGSVIVVIVVLVPEL